MITPRLSVLLAFTMLTATAGQASDEVPFSDNGDTMFLELSCEDTDSSTGSQLGSTYLNGYCYLYNNLQVQVDPRDKQLEELTTAVVNRLSEQCSAPEVTDPELKKLYNEACQFPTLFTQYALKRNELSENSEGLQFVEDWNMADVYVGNYQQDFFSDTENPFQIVSELIMAETRLHKSLQAATKLFRYTAPTGPRIEVSLLRMHLGLLTYSKPAMLLYILENLNCESIGNLGAKVNCAVIKDTAHLQAVKFLKQVPKDLHAYVDHLKTLGDKFKNSDAFDDRQGVTIGKHNYSTRPEVQRISDIIRFIDHIESVQKDKAFVFTNWQQPEMQKFLKLLEVLNARGGLPSNDLADTYRAVYDILLLKRMKDVTEKNQLMVPEISRKEAEIWKNNFIVLALEDTFKSYFTVASNIIDEFLAKFVDHKEN